MNVKQILMCGVCSVALFAAGVAVGQENIDAHTHPHLADGELKQAAEYANKYK
jgi:hypothetical protein